MNEKQAKKAVEKIGAFAWDPEKAHVLEDDLRQEFIELVAKRKDKIGKLARIVLTTSKFNFPRWCG